MHPILSHDHQHLAELLHLTLAEAHQFLAGLSQRPAGAVNLPDHAPLSLPAQGWGAEETLRTFTHRFAPWLSGSAGPRYFGFVTGGVTPAALMGDWLTSGEPPALADIQRYLALVQASGDAFLTPTVYQGRAAIRASITNWQTAAADIDLAGAAKRVASMAAAARGALMAWLPQNQRSI